MASSSAPAQRALHDHRDADRRRPAGIRENSAFSDIAGNSAGGVPWHVGCTERVGWGSFQSLSPVARTGRLGATAMSRHDQHGNDER